GRLPIERGFVLDADDCARRYVIRELLCRFAVDRTDLRGRFGVELDRDFAAARAEIARLEEESGAELVVERGERLGLTATGRLFVRNVCMAFDRYLPAQRATGRPAYSRTI